MRQGNNLGQIRQQATARGAILRVCSRRFRQSFQPLVFDNFFYFSAMHRA
jgi:hypothetical protein